jgi:hypothetical protein
VLLGILPAHLETAGLSGHRPFGARVPLLVVSCQSAGEAHLLAVFSLVSAFFWNGKGPRIRRQEGGISIEDFFCVAVVECYRWDAVQRGACSECVRPRGKGGQGERAGWTNLRRPWAVRSSFTVTCLQCAYTSRRFGFLLIFLTNSGVLRSSGCSNRRFEATLLERACIINCACPHSGSACYYCCSAT